MKSGRARFFAVLLFAPVFAHLLTPPATAGVPTKITYQGNIRQSGNLVTGQRNIVFRIYPSSTSSSALWTSPVYPVSVSTGVFKVDLEPALADLTAAAWETGSLWLELEIEGVKLSPRDELTSSPYSVNSLLHSGKRYTTAAVAPSTAALGDFWMDSSTNLFKYWDGAAWAPVGTVGGQPGAHASTHYGGGSDPIASLGAHTVAGTLTLANSDIAGAAHIAASSATFANSVTASSFTAAGALGVGAARLRLDPGVELTSTTAANYGGVYVSTHIYTPGDIYAARLYGDGSTLSGLGGTLGGGQAALLPYWTAANALGNSNLSRDSAASLTAINSTFTVQGKDAGGYSLWLSSGLDMANGTVNAGLFSGSGASLTNLNASSLAAGTVADARLSANVSLLDANQNVSGIKTFTSSLTVTSASGLSAPRAYFNPNVELSSTTAANYGGIYVSTHIYTPGDVRAARLYGDVTGVTGLPPGADSLGSHIATATLNMAGFNIVGAGSLTAAGPVTSYSSMTVAGAAGGYSLALSSGINMPAGTVNAGLFSGSGASLTALNASSLASGTVADGRLSANVSLLDANQNLTGIKTFASSVTVTSASGLSAPRAYFSPNVEMGSTTAANYGGIYVSTHIYTPGDVHAARLYGDVTGVTGLPPGADSLGTHIATATLNMAGFNIIGAGSLTAAGPITSYSSMTLAGADAAGYSLALSSGLSMPSGTVNAAHYAGAGAALTALNASSLATGTVADGRLSANVSLLDANQNLSGIKTFASSVTVANASGLSAPRAYFTPNVEMSSTTAANYGGIYVSTHIYTPGDVRAARLYGDVTGVTGLPPGADSLGTHIATDTLNMAGNPIVGVSSINLTAAGLTGPDAIFQVAVSTFVVRNNGYVGIGTLDPWEKLHISTGNILLRNSGGQAIRMVNTGIADNPEFRVGRILTAGDGSSAWRVLYTDDATPEIPVFEFDQKGIVASVKPTVGSHFEGFISGEVNPLFRLNSFPTMQLEFGAGGASATDVIMRRVSANTLGLRTAGADRLLIDPSGNIGISTGLPQGRLDVLAAGSAQTDMTQLWRDGTGVITASMSATGALMAVKFIGDGAGITNLTGGADSLGTHIATATLNMAAFDIAAVSTITVSSITTAAAGVTFSTHVFVMNGNLGVGTTAPAVSLHVAYESDGEIRVVSDSAYVRALDTTAGTDLVLWADNGGVGYVGTVSNHPLRLLAGGGSLTLENASGNLGLGTDTPAHKLHIEGDALVTSSLSVSGSGLSGAEPVFQVIGGTLTVLANGDVGISTNAPEARLDVKASGSAQTDMAQLWRDSGGVIIGSMSATGVMAAGYFVGNGAALTDLDASALTDGTLPDGRLSGTYSGALTFGSAAGGPVSFSTNVVLSASQLRFGNFAAPPSAMGVGAMYYDTGSQLLYYANNGGSWNALAAGGASPWGGAGGAVTLNTSTDLVGIGKAPAEKLDVAGTIYADFGISAATAVIRNTGADALTVAGGMTVSTITVSSITTTAAGVTFSTNVYVPNGNVILGTLPEARPELLAAGGAISADAALSVYGYFNNYGANVAWKGRGGGTTFTLGTDNNNTGSILTTYGGTSFILTNSGLGDVLKFDGYDTKDLFIYRPAYFSGSVGVGTTGATSKFDVSDGSITVRGADAALILGTTDRVLSPETDTAYGAGVKVSTNIYIVGFSSAAKYYGDGSSLTGVSTGTLKIGDAYGGGIVFWVDAKGRSALISATADQSSSIQWAPTTGFTGASVDGIGGGKSNTVMITTTTGPGSYAARLCADYAVTVGGVYYDDWYLPSKDESTLLYGQSTVVGGFTADWYWSSTEYVPSTTFAWAVGFFDGSTGSGLKSGGKYVRCVRAGPISAFDHLRDAETVRDGAYRSSNQTFTGGNTFTQGITASSFTATGIGVQATQLRLSTHTNVIISSEASTALGGGVRVSTNVYIVGFSSAAKYYGDGSSLTGIAGDDLGGHTATQDLDMAGKDIVSVSTLTVSSITTTAAGVTFSTNLFVMNGNVGIGTANPSAKLELLGGDLLIGGAAPSTLKGDGAESTLGGGLRLGVAGTLTAGGGVATTGGGGVYLYEDETYATQWISLISEAPGTLMLDTGGTTSSKLSLASLTDNRTFTFPDANGTFIVSDSVTGNVGISTGSPQARLDVLAAGSTPSDVAQIWRDSAGTVVSSMSAAGLLTVNSVKVSGAGTLTANTIYAPAGAGLYVANADDTAYFEIASGGAASIVSKSGTSASIASGDGANAFFGDYGRLVDEVILQPENGGAVGVLGNPAANPIMALLLLGNDTLYAGSAGGTYLGINPPGGFAGDLVNMQKGNAPRMIITGAGDVGLSTGAPQARLDVLAAGSAPSDVAQLWRNSAGTIVSSVSATGVMMASRFIGDGSGLTGAGDSLGSHIATATLNMAAFDIVGVSTLTVSSITTTAAGVTFSTNLFVMNGNVGIGTASPSAKLSVAGNMISNGTFTLGDSLSLSGLDTLTVGYGGNPVADQSTGRIRFPGYNVNHGSLAWYPNGYTPGGVSAAQGASFYLTGGGNNPVTEYDSAPANLSVSGALQLALKSANSKNKRILIFGDQEDASGYAAADDTGRMFFEGANVRHAFFVYRPKAATPRFYITGTGSQGGFDDLSMDLQVNGAGFFANDTGIGTASPAATLHVSSAVASAATNILLVSSGMASGQELLAVKGDGNVGIGTTSPGQKLHVLGGSIIVSQDGSDNIFIRHEVPQAGIAFSRGSATGGLMLNLASEPRFVNSAGVQVQWSASDLDLNTPDGGMINFGKRSDGSFANIVGYRFGQLAGSGIFMGLGNQGQVTLGAGLSQDDVLIKRNVTGAFAEEGTLLRLQKDITGSSTYGGEYLKWGTTAADLGVIDQSGSLGIGTAAPGARLEV
ncbi:MAG: DUF1566 domain-containing protein, partial [Elusimicrobia bacterium]|nr:DUF1566 domain-containing protein [Elusimicrobiota bacterium]